MTWVYLTIILVFKRSFLHIIDSGNKIHTSVQGSDKKSIPLQLDIWNKVVIRQKPSGTGKVK